MEVLEQPHQFQVVQQLMLGAVVEVIRVENQLVELEALEVVVQVEVIILQDLQLALKVQQEQPILEVAEVLKDPQIIQVVQLQVQEVAE